MRLIHKNTRETVKLGDSVTCFRGERTTTVSFFRKPHKPGSGGHFVTAEGFEYGVGAFCMEWIEREDRDPELAVTMESNEIVAHKLTNVPNAGSAKHVRRFLKRFSYAIDMRDDGREVVNDAETLIQEYVSTEFSAWVKRNCGDDSHRDASAHYIAFCEDLSNALVAKGWTRNHDEGTLERETA